MTSWSLQGSWLPKGDEEWNKEFERYKEYPEYKVLNKDMDVQGFKKIYFIEWFH